MIGKKRAKRKLDVHGTGTWAKAESTTTSHGTVVADESRLQGTILESTTRDESGKSLRTQESSGSEESRQEELTTDAIPRIEDTGAVTTLPDDQPTP
mgnify:CR=1 FL=1